MGRIVLRSVNEVWRLKAVTCNPELRRLALGIGVISHA